MEERGVCEREGLAIHVIQPPRERDALLGTRHRGVLIAQQPERVRGPGIESHRGLSNCRDRLGHRRPADLESSMRSFESR